MSLRNVHSVPTYGFLINCVHTDAYHHYTNAFVRVVTSYDVHVCHAAQCLTTYMYECVHVNIFRYIPEKRGL